MAVAPPRPRDLGLTALRAFEAAARLGGFTAAAQELGVTPGAVTAHIKALEDQLDVPLFERHPRGVRLSAAGARVLPGLTAAFDALGQAQHHLRAEAAPRRVHIAALPALAQLWLAPRLAQLRAGLPGVEISVTALETPPNLRRSPYDLSLFYGSEGIELARDWLFPVCAPSLAPRLRAPQDLAALPCLTDRAWAGDWDLWSAANLPGFRPRGPEFSLYALAVEEALGGAGVLMAHSALIREHLASGRLVAPLAGRVALPQQVRLLPARPLRPGRPVAQLARALGA